jgi:hypothetical protein
VGGPIVVWWWLSSGLGLFRGVSVVVWGRSMMVGGGSVVVRKWLGRSLGMARWLSEDDPVLAW